MNLEFLLFEGYSEFIWSAFIFTFICFFSLYTVTSKELKKYEKMFFVELKEFQKLKVKDVNKKKALEVAWSSSTH